MVRDLRVHDVGLVADEQGHDELHRRRRQRAVARPQATHSFGARARRQRPAPDAPAHPEQRKLRAVARGSRATSRGDRAGSDRRTRPNVEPGAALAPCERVRLLGVAARRRTASTARRPAGSSHAWSGWVSGEPGSEHDGRLRSPPRATASRTSASSPWRSKSTLPNGSQTRRDPEDRARDAILLSACASRLAFGREAAASIPASRRAPSTRDRSAKTVRSSTRAPGAAQRAHRRAEREHAVVGVRRDDDDPAPRHYHRGLGCGEQDVRPRLEDVRAGSRSVDRLRPASRSRGRLAAPAPAEARRPPPHDPDRRQLGLRARHADRPGLRRAFRRRATPTTSADEFSRSPRPTTRRRFGRGVEQRRHPHGGRKATRRRRSSATSRDAPHIPDDSFDCAIVTQTLQFVYDVRAALATLHRILAPGRRAPRDRARVDEDLAASRTTQYGEWWHYTARSFERDSAPRLSARETSRSSRTATCSQQPGSSTGSPRPTSQPRSSPPTTRSTRSSSGSEP